MILPDWFWRLRRSRAVTPYDSRRVNPSSYDLCLGAEIRLQVYKGIEYDNEEAWLTPDGRVIFDDLYPARKIGWFHDHRTDGIFEPGDCVLASTVESLNVPKWARMQGMLKSSVAREGLNHRTALYIDPGFLGQITLELEFARSGRLIPHMPILQVEAQLCFPLRSYQQTGRYNHQAGPTLNKNKEIAFCSTVTSICSQPPQTASSSTARSAS